MGIEIEEMALLMSIPEVREATDAEKIDDINIRRLSSLMKKSDDVFLGGMIKDEKVSGSVVLVLWVVKKEIEEYMIDNKVEMKSDDEVKSLFARQFTDGHRLRMVGVKEPGVRQHSPPGSLVPQAGAVKVRRLEP